MSKMTVDLVPHDPDWARQAAREGERFAALVGDSVVRVHHIGSTSIPGIQAKPTLDLLPEVCDLAALDACREAVLAAGYEWRGEYGLPGRRFCPRSDAGGRRLANLHCYQTGSPEIQRHLAFRDYLRVHPDVARRYETEKLRCRDLHPDDVFAYTDAKSDWIRRVEQDALAWSVSDAPP